MTNNKAPENSTRGSAKVTFKNLIIYTNSTYSKTIFFNWGKFLNLSEPILTHLLVCLGSEMCLGGLAYTEHINPPQRPSLHWGWKRKPRVNMNPSGGKKSVSQAFLKVYTWVKWICSSDFPSFHGLWHHARDWTPRDSPELCNFRQVVTPLSSHFPGCKVKMFIPNLVCLLWRLNQGNVY